MVLDEHVQTKSQNDEQARSEATPLDNSSQGSETTIEIQPRRIAKAKVEHASPNQPVKDILLALAQKEFELDEVWKTYEVELLLGNDGVSRIMRTSRNRYEKWLAKTGKNFLKLSQINRMEAEDQLALMDFLKSKVLDFFGVTGMIRGLYRTYALKLWSILKKNEPSGWIKPAMQVYREWCQKEELDKDLLRILTYVVLKGYAWYLKNASQP